MPEQETEVGPGGRERTGFGLDTKSESFAELSGGVAEVKEGQEGQERSSKGTEAASSKRASSDSNSGSDSSSGSEGESSEENRVQALEYVNKQLRTEVAEGKERIKKQGVEIGELKKIGRQQHKPKKKRRKGRVWHWRQNRFGQKSCWGKRSGSKQRFTSRTNSWCR